MYLHGVVHTNNGYSRMYIQVHTSSSGCVGMYSLTPLHSVIQLVCFVFFFSVIVTNFVSDSLHNGSIAPPMF